MNKKYLCQRLTAVAAMAGVLVLAGTTMWAGRKQHDASRKATPRTIQADKPVGVFGPGIELPRTFTESSRFASQNVRKGYSFDVNEGGNARLKNIPQRVMPAAPLRACVSYDLDRKAYGMVNVTPDGLETIREHEGLQAGWGGAGVGNRYYFNTCADVVGGAVASIETYLWDTTNWVNIGYDQNPTPGVLSYSMTSHPVTETIYGCFFSDDLQSVEIGTLDPMSMKRTGVIGTVQTPLYAMGFDSECRLYGIDKAGVLYSVSLDDASYTKLAETGITTDYNTTGTVDNFNDIFYYAACPQGPEDDPSRDWALYSIDLRNGYQVSKCWNLRAELGGMYIANAAAKPFAPAAPSLRNVTFEDGSLDGTIAFKAPIRTFNGNDLVGQLDYGVIANDKVIATGTVNAGAEAVIDLTLPEAGMYTLRVYVSNGEGDSPKSESVTRWIGNGRPLQPTGLKAEYTYGASQIALSWNPVTSSLNNGYLNTGEVKYTLTRTIDGGDPVVVADRISDTSFTDEIGEQDACRVYRYTLTAHHEEQVSAEALSDYVAVGALMPPFVPDFMDPMSIGYFTTNDRLNLGHKWIYSSYDAAFMMIWNTGWGSSNMDAALVTAPVRLEGGKAYEIAYNSYVESNGTFGIGLQWGTTPDATETLVEPVSISSATTSWQDPLRQSAVVMPEKDGIYYFAVRALAQGAQSAKIFIDGYSISQGLSVKAPAEVTDVTLLPQYDGSKKLDISFKAPAVDIRDKKLSSLSKIEVCRNGECVKTFRNPTFGQELSFTDTGSKNEDVVYTITAYNTEGPGRTWYGHAHMGVNLPASPVDCGVVQNMDKPGEVTVTWTPVAKDVDGNDIDPSLIRYAIFASDYSTMLLNNLTASNPKATFRAIDPNAGQAFVYYLVVPYTEGGTNGYAGGFGITPMIPVGTPFELPYIESFQSGLSYPMGVENTGTDLRLAQMISSGGLTIGSQDNDNGLLAWYTIPGTKFSLSSANINIDDTDDVAMSFYYAGVPDMTGYIIAPMVVCEGETTALCDSIDTKDCAEKGWNRVQASLVPWRGKTVQFVFNVLCVDNNFGFGLDNVVLKRYAANDLRAGTLSAPIVMTIGKNHELVAEIVNDGSDDAPAGYQVDLYADGKLVNTVEGPALPAFNTAAVPLDYMPDPFSTEEKVFRAEIRWNLDEILANNISSEIVVAVAEAIYPGVTDLVAKLADDTNSADLTWSEPNHEPRLHEITESFEDYEPFTIAGFGDWRVFDGDGLETWYIGRGTYVPGVGNGPSYPNGTTPKSWMVIDPSQMKLSYEGARTGEKSAMATSSRDVADDWLISPELPGIAQTVSFWAATAAEDCGEESFEFYYSTGGTAPEDFIQIGDVVDVPEGDWEEDEYGDEVQVTTWYEYTYELPEGAKYFAIRYVSDNIYALLLDDVTFTISDEVLELRGYNLFRNGSQLNDELLAAASFKDDTSLLSDGEYTYAVETVYDKGHSGLSNLETLNLVHPNSLNTVIAQGVTVSTEKGYIIVSGAEGKRISISTPAGITIYDSVPAAELRLAVEPGIYMVRLGKQAVKVIVR